MSKVRCDAGVGFWSRFYATSGNFSIGFGGVPLQVVGGEVTGCRFFENKVCAIKRYDLITTFDPAATAEKCNKCDVLPYR